MQLITPNWPAPMHVKAFSTTRLGGVSSGPFNELNLGTHVGDDAAAVVNNRAMLEQAVNLPSAPLWLEQTHSIEVIEHTGQVTNNGASNGAVIAADGAYTHASNHVCVVMTADCLPLLLTNKQGDRVAAVHAGWRGMADGIIEQAVTKLDCDPQDVFAWAGPCISQQAFEVGLEVKQQLGGPDSAYRAHKEVTKVYANLTQLAQHRLAQLGIDAFFTNDHCTYKESERFFSYRRDGQTGRMATLIWFESN